MTMLLSIVTRNGNIMKNKSQLLRIHITTATTLKQLSSMLRPINRLKQCNIACVIHGPIIWRQFQTKTGKSVKNLTSSQRSTVTGDTIQAQTSQLAKELDLSKQERLSLQLGMQQGLSLRNIAVTEDEPKGWKGMKFHWEIIPVVLVAIFLYRLLSSSVDIKMSFGMPPNNYLADIPSTTFDDVKGIDEVKGELEEIVDFLKDPDRFTNLGAKLPKGILLVGPPGTGKTLLARAVAGQAGVPFFYAAGSEFEEMFVGVGGSRIRQLFKEARDNSPCIIFIDEIDACGSARTSSPLAPYGRITINQLLQEMDGFETKQGIIVIGATNMPDVLDKALTRPGRFDTQISVLPPDVRGRREILEHYASKVTSSLHLDLQKIASLTGGMTGADLSNLVNQAALMAAEQSKDLVDMEDFENALDKLRLGPELNTRMRTKKELEITAFHEAGHALVAYYSKNSLPIFKVTIAQRGHALGHTSLIPTEVDETQVTRAKIMWKIDVAMGGRVAEELMNGNANVTTGASNDLEMATKLAYSLVCDFGMSEALGLVAIDLKKVSPDKKRIIEEEVNRILTASYNRAKTLLTEKSHQHNLLSKALLKYETLNLEQIKSIFSHNTVDCLQESKN